MFSGRRLLLTAVIGTNTRPRCSHMSFPHDHDELCPKSCAGPCPAAAPSSMGEETAAATTRQELRVKNGVPTAVELWEDLSHELWQVQVGVGGEANARMMTLEELDASFKRNDINTRTLVRKPGTLNWKTLGQIAGLAPSEPTPAATPAAKAKREEDNSVEDLSLRDIDVSDVSDAAVADPGQSSLSPFATDISLDETEAASPADNAGAKPLPTHKIRALSTEELRVARPSLFSKKTVGVATAALLAGSLLVMRFVPSVHERLTHHEVAPPPHTTAPIVAIATPVATTTPFVAPTPAPAPAPASAPAPAPTTVAVATTAPPKVVASHHVATNVHSTHTAVHATTASHATKTATTTSSKAKLADAKTTKKKATTAATTTASVKAKTAPDAK